MWASFIQAKTSLGGVGMGGRREVEEAGMEVNRARRRVMGGGDFGWGGSECMMGE